MHDIKAIKSALISVYHKDGVDTIARMLHHLGVNLYSTGGTFDFIRSLGLPCLSVESITGFPSIFGGRVKTLHPAVFGGILFRRDNAGDQAEREAHSIPPIDLVIVDLYPFENTVSSGAAHEDIIEKIDIGGISLIRAAAKNYNDVVIVSSTSQYAELIRLLDEKKGSTSLEDRYRFAAQAFNVSSHYDSAIFNYLNREGEIAAFKASMQKSNTLRYGENPHQKGLFFGDLNQVFDQLHGKEISYNNLVDLEAAISLIDEFAKPAFAVIKHTNACGLATRNSLLQAWLDALACDPVSAYGGVIAANRVIDEETAAEMNKLFMEIVIAPGYEKNALEILKSKKNRILLQRKNADFQASQFRSILNGILVQDKDRVSETPEMLKVVTHSAPTAEQVDDLLFANIAVKHLKSNAIVLARNGQLLGTGCGMTSRVDALKHAISKAHEFGFDLNGAVMASDAYFPFADSVEIAYNEGINAVIQPGGSVRDDDSISFCNQHSMCMVFTGIRHFKH
ncbi:MAG TPA: bifunctional phosphoribosylaminoimidazolecarboxamide formyltransferase/IMP cyclohydrolase [Bacteroidales bacterium]|nr:bifunctional phosphoribosylaminoimidazolecarboxamide formyltransferase/IMP cyclohydrolase [Bacteroidales bacterium]